MKHPLPVLLFALAVGMAASSTYAGMRAASHSSPSAEVTILPEQALTSEHLIGVAGQTAIAWDETVRVPANLAVSYISMGKPVNRAFMHWVERDAHGARPAIEILPYDRSLKGIIRGDDDTWLRDLRREIDEPVVISFAPEADGGWYSWGDQPRAFIAAWRHVVRVLGHRYVTWMWQMSAHSPFTKFWPGARYVNWVGLDGYFVSPASTFESVFGRYISEVQSFTKRPIVLSETAVGPRTKHAVRDIRAMFAGAAKDHIKGVIWFDRKSRGSARFLQDWRLAVDKPALREFRIAARKYQDG